MKRVNHSILLLGLLLGLASCKSSYVVTIETQKPAAVSIPGTVDGVVVVNNAIPQPPTLGIALRINEKATDIGQALETDTTLWNAVVQMAQSIQNANYFNKTLVYEQALRDDNEWLSPLPIPWETCDSIFREAECNVIISVDRLLYNMREAVITPASEEYFIHPDYVYIDIKCQISMTCSVYCLDQEKRLTSFTVQDSVFLNEPFEKDSLDVYKHIPNFVLKEAALVIAEKAAAFLTPSWQTAQRVVYSSYSSRMQEADKYFVNQKWEQARAIWGQLFREKEKSIDRARLAMNIAVSYEMEDDLNAASEWAQRSKHFYDKLNSADVSNEKQRADQYLSALSVRIQNNKNLDLQLRNP
ncbi:MAG: DUF6340 family protein [Dysgonamonadaceae bacterium]|nr:DUF6340 family protein [Dysgonamonadaceae bacterium]